MKINYNLSSTLIRLSWTLNNHKPNEPAESDSFPQTRHNLDITRVATDNSDQSLRYDEKLYFFYIFSNDSLK